jgi:D-alanyl-D-alanine carboxypeptidase
MSLDSALKILMVKSANDVAVGVAETVGGSLDQFVAMMNAQAARLGMGSTHFINPHGLPGKGQYTTARDLAVLAVQLVAILCAWVWSSGITPQVISIN